MRDGTGSDIEDILGQFYIAFGQGLGSLRVSRRTAAALRERYLMVINSVILEEWDSIGSEVLERVRAVGRMAAIRAATVGRTYVVPEDFIESSRAVERESETPVCLPPGV